MDFSFFITNNKSGYKTKESWFSKNYPDEYNKIISYCEKHSLKSFKEKIWFYYKGLIEIPKCIGCGSNISFSNRFDRGYNDFCSLTCANNNKEELIKRQKETNKQRWGVDFYTQHKDFVKKQKATKKQRYGDENYSNPEKMKKTKRVRYGDEGYNNSYKNRVSRRESFIKSIKQKTKDLFVSYNLVDDDITLNCSICDENYLIYNNLFNYRTKQKSVLCTKCNPTEEKQTSGLEIDLTNFISSVVDVEIKNRSVLNGKEVDIIVPSNNLGVEFNGLYWHSDLYKDNDYHLNKTKLANKNNYNLIHVFEDEWLDKPKIVKSIIKSRLGIYDTTIYARNCKIKLVSKGDEREFLNKNHIQGFVGSKFCYGLYFDNELISVMSFGGLRKSLGHKSKEDSWEMLRFCNKLNTKVIGGASKLFKHFINNHKPLTIISYSDNRYFSGELYNKLGFFYDGETSPNYYYVIGHNRHNRFNFRKDKLVKEGFDPNKTEKQIMMERGYYRIYDCGNKRWKWNNANY